MQNKSKNILIVLLGLIILVLVVFFIFIQNKKEKIVDEEIRSEIVLTDFEEKIKTEAPAWSDYWIGEDAGSNLSMFIKFGDKRSIIETEYPYDFEANKLREKRFYIYSPNKTKIIDPNGQIALHEEDGEILEGLDVDSSVKLIDVKTNKFKQILTCGTPCVFNDAVWIDDNSFVVLGQAYGLKEFDECKVYEECQSPLLYVFDLSNNEYVLYHGPERLLEIAKEEISSESYTYKNHGFTIELPKGFIPKEEQAESGPAIMIPLPTGSLTYVTNTIFWEKSNIPSYTYIRDEKIGETNFKLYKYSETYLYWYKRGNVGYEFGGTDKNAIESLIKTFKFVGWSQ